MSIICIILIIIAILIIITSILLYIGLRIHIKIDKEDNYIKGFIKVYLTKIKIFQKEFKNNKGTNKKTKENNNNKSIIEKYKDIKPFINLIKINLNDINDFIKYILKYVIIKNVYTNIKIGLNSPVETAKSAGYLWIIATPFNLLDNTNIIIEPIFNKEIIDFKINITINFKLLKPSIQILKLITKKSNRDFLKELINIIKNKKGKEYE